MNAAQRRERAKADYAEVLAVCPTRQLLETISSKWVALALSALAEDAAPHERSARRGLRYSDLGRRLAGITPKMLTQTLRALERDGLVTRTVVPTVPVTVTYSVTELGESLHELLTTMKGWAEQNMPAVLAHRELAEDAREGRLKRLAAAPGTE